MTVIFPSRTTKVLKQNNRSKILGELWSSFNLDLQSNLGVIKVSPRLQLNTGGVANQGISVAFKSFDQFLFTVADTRIFKSGAFNLVSAFTEDASSGALTDYTYQYSDLETFNNLLIGASNTTLASKVSNGSGTGAWTNRITFGSTGALHKLLWFTKYNRLYYFDNFQEIRSVGTSSWTPASSGNYFISLDYKLGFAYTMASDSSDIWIGTAQAVPAGFLDSFTPASILRWDGISNQITTEYKVKARGVLALCKDDRNIMHAIDSNGALLAFTGSGFEEIGRLPLNRELLKNAIPGSTVTYNSYIHPNGFCFSRNGTFLVMVDNLVGDNGATIKENFPSGVWEFHKDTGFVHRQSLSYNPMNTSTVTDWGQNRISQAGALYEPSIYSESAIGKPTLVCGATYYNDASTTTSGIFIDDPLDTVQKYGYFVTIWMLSTNVIENWQKISLKYRKLLNATDKIVLKYRTTEASSIEISGTWDSTTAFHTSTNISALTGYEVEVIQGTGSGKCSHITSVSGSGPYTANLDETYTGVAADGTFKARIQAWKKLSVTSDQTTESMIKTINDQSGAMRIQIKCCMQFTGEDEVYELAVISKPNELLV